MKRYIAIIYFFIFGNNLIFCQDKIVFKDTVDNRENYKKENGIVRYTNSLTKNSKQYYIQEQGNSFLMTFPSRSNINVANYFEMTSNYFKFSEDNQFILKEKKSDINGNNIYIFQQYFMGIKVEGGNYRIFENSNGQILTVIGRKLEVRDFNAEPTITLDMAINSAIEGLRIDLKDSLTSGITYLNADLLIIANGTNNANNEFVLAYEVKLNQKNTHDKFIYYINANNGYIVKKKNTSFDDIAVGNGNTNYSGNQNFLNTFGLFDFILNDETRNITVYDANYSSFYELPLGLNSFQDNDNLWNEKVAHISSVKINSINDLWNDYGTEIFPDIYLKFYDSDGDFIYATSPVDDLIFPYTFDTISAIKWPFSIEIWDFDIIGGDDLVGGKYVDDMNENYNYEDGICNFDISKRVINRPEIDVFWGLQKTHEFYLNMYGRLGVDGSNAQIDAYLYLDPFYQNPLTNSYQINNATGNSAYQTIKFGLGDGINYMPFVDLETVGHEYTHLVIGATSNLAYEGESGALNESFADIMGTAIDISLNGITETTWKHGEKHFVNPYYYSRSLSNPNLVYDPKTYKTDTFWVDVVDCEPSSLNDRCGVHTNSGVQNYWYYLLSTGGAGVNANGDEFNVTPIGWEKASKIAYYNMTEHLFSGDGYPAAAIGSLAYVIESEPDGANSATWNSVVNAWYAVGVLDDPAQFCSGLLELNESEGIITDGSIDNLYGNNSNCSWLIKPEGATSITLSFSEFFTEADNDTLIVYNGGAITDPILLIWHGNTIPPIVSSSVGEMLIVFRSDGDNNDYGWTANYISSTATLGCTGTISLNANAGFFSDGSGAENYANNSNCSWLIAPLSASSITISFSSFNTEPIYDYVNVYDGYNSASPLLGTYSGTSIPASITTMGSAIFVQFISDGAINSSGWSVNYTSDGMDPIITSMSTYEYWFDNNYFGKTDGFISGPTPNFNESIDVSTLTSGLHSIHIRFKDKNNLWSSVLSQFFVKTQTGVAENVINSGEYWFDNNYAGKIDITGINSEAFNYIESVDVNSLTNGLHSFHIRFKDENNLWSSVLTQYFVKVPQFTTPNLITTYEYWFDSESYASATSITLPTPINSYSLDDVVDVTALTEASHTIHFRFQDINGQWSSVVTDTFSRVPFVTANFTVAPVAICAGGAVTFDNLSVNATSYLWDFGDGTTSTLMEPTHIYAGGGIYTVTLTAYNDDLIASDDFTILDAISVTELNTLVTPGGSTTFCSGESVILSCNTGFTSYQWYRNGVPIAGATNANYTVTKTGSYTVGVYQGDCFTVSTAISVTVNPKPKATVTNMDVTNDLCFDTSIKLKGSSGAGYTWQWYKDGSAISGATSQIYFASTSGDYKVKVTAPTGCKKTSTPVTIIQTCKAEETQTDIVGLVVYPNPNDGIYTLTFTSACNTDVTISIFDAVGQLVIEDSGLVEDNSFTRTYDLTNNAKGTYTVRVICGDGTYFETVLVQ